MKIINLCPVPIKFFPNSWKELGLALAICSYYISAVISYSFGNEIPLGFELFPIVFGTIIIIHGLCHGSISKSGLLTIGFYCLVLCAMLFSLFYVNHLNNSLIYILRYTYAALFLGFVSVILGSNKQFSPDFFLFWLSIVVSFLVVFAFVTGGTHGGRLTITNSNPIYFSSWIQVTSATVGLIPINT